MQVNDTDIYYVSLGSGTPVIFVHGGLGLDHQYFRLFLDPLGDSMNVVLLDLPGHGRSDRTPASNLTIDRMTDDCVGLAAEVGFDRFVLAGHSYGGFIAMNAALRYGDRLAGLILLCTGSDFSFGVRDPLGGTQEQQDAIFKGLFAGPDVVSSDTALRYVWMRAWALYYNNAAPPKNVLEELDARSIYSAAAFNRGLEVASPDASSPFYYNLTPQLSKIRVPTYVAYGGGATFGSSMRRSTWRRTYQVLG